MVKPGAMRMTFYAQTRASIDAVVGNVESVSLRAPIQLEPFWITLKPLHTGMSSGEFETSPISAVLGKRGGVLVKIDYCRGPGGVARACPPVRVVGVNGVSGVHVVNRDSTVCYD